MSNNLRTCILSREKLLNSKLIQINYSPTSKIKINNPGKPFFKGRSIYLKETKINLEKIQKMPIGFFKRFLKKDINPKQLEDIKKSLSRF